MNSLRITNKYILEHESKGKYIDIGGVNIFYLDQGEGEVIFCLHGVPTSSYMYRKVADSLVKMGLRVVAIDLPGLGLSLILKWK
jgi:pimeloyl-ACP methyl ester carboxylesterase